MRYAAGIEYNGKAFSGWQRQAHADSVQARVEAALSRVADQPVDVVCAGRTDAGVHALNQVVHFDATVHRRERSWVLGTNSHLPESVNLNWVREVPHDFHARFSALSRSYRYVILNRWVRPGVEAGRVTWIHYPLDAEAMHRAGQALLGEHDFSSYRAVACQARSPMRNVERVSVSRSGDHVVLEISANAFLHHMVRNIAGVLIEIGKGERPESWARDVLEYRDRTLGGVTASPDGLYFLGPRYPEHLGIPAGQTWATDDRE